MLASLGSSSVDLTSLYLHEEKNIKHVTCRLTMKRHNCRKTFIHFFFTDKILFNNDWIDIKCNIFKINFIYLIIY